MENSEKLNKEVQALAEGANNLNGVWRYALNNESNKILISQLNQSTNLYRTKEMAGGKLSPRQKMMCLDVLV